MLNEDGVTGQVPVDDGGTAGVQKTASIEGGRQEEPGQRVPERCRAGGKRVGKPRSSPECRQDLRTPALPGLAADARFRRVGTKRLLSLRSPPAPPLLSRGHSESPRPTTVPKFLPDSLQSLAHSPYPGVHGLVVLLGLFEELLEAARRHVFCDEDDLRAGGLRRCGWVPMLPHPACGFTPPYTRP